MQTQLSCHVQNFKVITRLQSSKQDLKLAGPKHNFAQRTGPYKKVQIWWKMKWTVG